MTMFRSMLLTLAFLFMLPAPAQARPSFLPDGDFELGASIGGSAFIQEGHAPPLCCGERDDWTAVGPRFGLMAAWLPADAFRLALHVDLFVGGTSTPDGDRDLVTFGNRIAADWVIRAIKPIRILLGAEAGFELVSGTYARDEFVGDDTDFLLMFGLHTGAIYPLTREIGVGLDFRYIRSFVNARFDAVAAIVWSL